MKRPKCNFVMNAIEPQQTYSSSTKIDYKCFKCGTMLIVTKSSNPSGSDSVQIIFPELKDATG